MMPDCPVCGKTGVMAEDNTYKILNRSEREGKYECEDCGERFWW